MIRNSGALMPVRNRLLDLQTWRSRDWEANPPTLREVQEWRESMRRMAERRICGLPSAEGFAHLFRMRDAEARFKEIGLLA